MCSNVSKHPLRLEFLLIKWKAEVADAYGTVVASLRFMVIMVM